MANINEILARAAALRDETALNSISPERAGGIMYDTLLALNELWLQQGAALVISKIYASVAAMEADTAPVSDLTGKPLRPGQIVVIASSDSDNGSVYRYNGTESPSWSMVGSIGNLDPVDSLDSDSTTLPLAAHQGKVLDGKISQLGQKTNEINYFLGVTQSETQITDFSAYPEKSGTIYDGGYAYNAGGSFGKHIEINITGKSALKIVAGENATIYALLKRGFPNSFLSQADVQSLYSSAGDILPSGSSGHIIQAGGEIDVAIPSDALYLYIYSTTPDGVSIVPSSVTIIGHSQSSVIEELQESTIKAESDIADIKGDIGFQSTETTISDFSSQDVYNGNFAYGGFLLANQGTNLQMPIPSGTKKIIIKSGSNASTFAFLKAKIRTNLSSADMPLFVIGDNTQGTAIPANTNALLKVPDGAKFLYYRKTDNASVNLLPEYVTFVAYSSLVDDVPNKIDKIGFYSSVALFENIAVVGDSFSSGAIIGVEGVIGGDRYNLSWLQIMARKNGAIGVNYSFGGATVESWLARTEDNRGLQGLLADSPKNLYFIKLGINGTYESLGSIADCHSDFTQNADSFYGNYGRIIGNIKSHAPSAKIICINNSVWSGADRNSAIEEIAEFYGVAYIDEYEDDFFTSDFYLNTMSGGHPIGVTYAGMEMAYERLFSICATKYPQYFQDYVG